MCLLSALLLIGILKIKSNEHNHTKYERKFHNMNKERINKRNQGRHISNKAQTISKEVNKRNMSTTSNPPHSNRRKRGKTYQNLKTVHAPSVENEFQANNHLRSTYDHLQEELL